jgi:methionyl-tRNA synthetase
VFTFKREREPEVETDIVRAANNYIAQTEPWKLAKTNPVFLKDVIFDLWNALRLTAASLYPFMPATAEKIWGQLGLRSLTEETSKSLLPESGKDRPGTFDWEWKPDYEITVAKGEQLFPRIEKDRKEKVEENKAEAKPEEEKAGAQNLITICDGKGRTENRRVVSAGKI